MMNPSIVDDSDSDERLARCRLEIRVRDETIRMLREQSARQQQVIDAQREALNVAQDQLADMGRSLSWRVASFVRDNARRIRART